MFRSLFTCCACALAMAVSLSLSIAAHAADSAEYKSGKQFPEPRPVDPGPIAGPPSDAIILLMVTTCRPSMVATNGSSPMAW